MRSQLHRDHKWSLLWEEERREDPVGLVIGCWEDPCSPGLQTCQFKACSTAVVLSLVGEQYLLPSGDLFLYCQLSWPSQLRFVPVQQLLLHI